MHIICVCQKYAVRILFDTQHNIRGHPMRPIWNDACYSTASDQHDIIQIRRLCGDTSVPTLSEHHSSVCIIRACLYVCVCVCFCCLHCVVCFSYTCEGIKTRNNTIHKPHKIQSTTSLAMKHTRSLYTTAFCI